MHISSNPKVSGHWLSTTMAKGCQVKTTSWLGRNGVSLIGKSPTDIPMCIFTGQRFRKSPGSMKCARFPYWCANSLVEQWPHDRVSLGVSFVVQRVQVGQQSVANVQVMLGAVHQQGVGSKHSWILMLETNTHCYYWQVLRSTLPNVWKAVSEGCFSTAHPSLSIRVIPGFILALRFMPRSSQGLAWWLL